MKKVFVLLFLMGCVLPCVAQMSPDFDSEDITVAVAFKDSGSSYIDSLGRGWLGSHLVGMAGWATLGLMACDIQLDPQGSSCKMSIAPGGVVIASLATYLAMFWVISRLGSQELQFSKRNFAAFLVGMIGACASPAVSLGIGITAIASKFFRKSKVVVLPKAAW